MSAGNCPKPKPPALDKFQPVTQEVILNIVKKLGPASSVLDPVPTVIIKKVIQVILPDITNIVNHSLLTGEVPTSWKQGIITPLPKKPGPEPYDLANLRPVTQLRLLPRITESIITQQVQAHLEQHSLLHDLQSGFRPERGTELAVADMREQLLWHADRSHPAVLVLLDLSAAFDTVDHPILLQRAKDVAGINGLALKWLESYLDNRSQAVKFDGCCSSQQKVKFGVPQGSALSPVLFNIYLRPLADLVAQAGLPFQMYADDTQILANLHESSKERDRLAPCLTLISEWMRQNKLCLNNNKTELLMVEGTRGGTPPLIPWPPSWGVMPTPTTQSKDLGINISHHLDGAAHAAATVKACHHHLNKLSRVLPLLEVPQKKTLIQAIIGSRLCYGLLFMLSATQKTIYKLQKVQNRGIRYIYNLKRSQHISPWRLKLGWLSIKDQIILRLCLWIWKARRKQGPQYSHHWTSRFYANRARRRICQDLLPLPRFKKQSKGGTTIAAKGAKTWNSLPMEIRTITSQASFKSSVKQHLLKREGCRIQTNQEYNNKSTNHIKPSPSNPQPVTILPPQGHDHLASVSLSPLPMTPSLHQEPNLQVTINPFQDIPLLRAINDPRSTRPTGLTSPPLPSRNNQHLINLARRNKLLNLQPDGSYRPRTVGP